MLKHALLNNREMWIAHLRFDVTAPDWQLLQQLVQQSIETKQRIVEADPHEKGLRKALNLGHTMGMPLKVWPSNATARCCMATRWPGVWCANCF